jgi:hypothetical protein
LLFTITSVVGNWAGAGPDGREDAAGREDGSRDSFLLRLRRPLLLLLLRRSRRSWRLWSTSVATSCWGRWLTWDCCELTGC